MNQNEMVQNTVLLGTVCTVQHLFTKAVLQGLESTDDIGLLALADKTTQALVELEAALVNRSQQGEPDE